MVQELTVGKGRLKSNSARFGPTPLLVILVIGLGALGILSFAAGWNLAALAATGMVGILLLWTVVAWKNSFRTALYFLLILAIVWLPPLSPVGNVRLRIHQLVFSLILPFIVLWRPRTVKRVDVWLVIFSVAIVLSLLMGYASGNPPLLRDWFELAKPGFWWLMFSFGLGSRWRPDLKERALWILLGTGVGVGLFTVAQYLDWGGINNWLTPLFVPVEERLSRLTYRAVGTFGNPNRLGLFMTAELCIALVFLLFSSPGKWRRLGLIAYLCGTVGIILLTSSRFAFAATALSVGVLCWTRIRHGRFLPFTRILIIGFGVLLAVVGGVLVLKQADLIASTMKAGQALRSGNPLVVTSYRLGMVTEEIDNSRRISDWKTAWQLGMESPMFGSGPSKGVDEFTYFHSEYLSVFRRHGFFGLFVFLVLYGNIAVYAYRSFHDAITRQDRQRMLVTLSALAVVSVFVMHGVFSNTFASDFQMSAVLWWMIGVLYGREEKPIMAKADASSYDKLRARLTENRVNHL